MRLPVAFWLVLFASWSQVQAEQHGLFTYVDAGSHIIITDYPQDAVGSVVIPEKIGDKWVTEIGRYAFYTSVQLPS